jgi:hypothetical protein
MTKLQAALGRLRANGRIAEKRQREPFRAFAAGGDK